MHSTKQTATIKTTPPLILSLSLELREEDGRSSIKFAALVPPLPACKEEEGVPGVEEEGVLAVLRRWRDADSASLASRDEEES